MLKINQNTIETVSIKDLKATEEVLKLYNNHINKSDEERMYAVIAETKGKLTEKEYNDRIEHAKSFTVEHEVPNPSDWAQIRTLYRERGNQKIAEAREKHESISKEYTGTASVVDERYGNISPRQAVINHETAVKNVNLIKKMGVVLSLGLGILVFLAIVTAVHFIFGESIKNVSLILVQLVGGISGFAGLVLGGILGRIIVKNLLKKQRAERDYFEMVAFSNREVIEKLQMAIKSSEENIKRIEAQYGVEILAKTDFSELVPFDKKAIKKVQNNEPKQEEIAKNKEEEGQEGKKSSKKGKKAAEIGVEGA